MRYLLSSFFAFAVAITSFAQNPGGKPLPEWMRDPRNLVSYSRYPDYPSAARQAHMVGSGIYLLQLRPNGTVASVEVVRSTGHRELDQACVQAFHTWHFKPKVVQVTPKVKIPVTFSMDGVHL